MYYLTKELHHHGILGMKWGIRRYQPYPKGHVGGKEIGEAAKSKVSTMSDEEFKRFKADLRSKVNRDYVEVKDVFYKEKTNEELKAIKDLRHDRVIEKGSIAYRISSTPNESSDGRTFVYFSDHDNRSYNEQLTQNSPDKFRNKYVVKKDLKLPSMKTLTNAYLDVVLDSVKSFDLSTEEAAKRIGKNALMVNYALNKTDKLTLSEAKDMLTDDFIKSPNSGMNVVMRSILKGNSNDLSSTGEKLVDRLQKLGYDGMTDLNDFSSFATSPTFIFDKKKSLSIKTVEASKYNNNFGGIDTLYKVNDGIEEKYKVKYLN